MAVYVELVNSNDSRQHETGNIQAIDKQEDKEKNISSHCGGGLVLVDAFRKYRILILINKLLLSTSYPYIIQIHLEERNRASGTMRESWRQYLLTYFHSEMNVRIYNELNISRDATFISRQMMGRSGSIKQRQVSPFPRSRKCLYPLFKIHCNVIRPFPSRFSRKFPSQNCIHILVYLLQASCSAYLILTVGDLHSSYFFVTGKKRLG
jgi:hypothetical protein